jgi:acetyl-CoA carboxylase biotin carboxyl carrier protein
MDFNEIRKLVKLVEGSAISSLEIEEDGLQIRIEKTAPPGVAWTAPPVPAAPAAPQPMPQAATQPAPQAAAAPPPAPTSNLIDVRAPMVGTFYLASNPEAPPFVRVGDAIRPGQTLCILEAMKIMNEIEAEASGTLVEILIDNGQPVQFDQVLFRIEP